MRSGTYARAGFRSVGGLVFLCLASAAGGAEMYRWRNADGQLEFGDRPPAGVAAERLDVKPLPSKLSPAEARAEVERLRATEVGRRQAAESERAAAEAAAGEAAARAAERVQGCAEARWALSALESGRPVYRDEEGHYRIKRPPRTSARWLPDAADPAGVYRIKRAPGQGDAYTGKREYLDDATRAQETDTQMRRVIELCGRAPSAAEKAQTAEEILHAEECEKVAADLALLTRAGSKAAREEIDARREFLDRTCAR